MDHYAFDVEQSFAGSSAEPPTDYNVDRTASDVFTVGGRIEVEAETLQEAFGKAVDQFLDDMTAAGWEGTRVTGGIRATQIIPGLANY